MEPIDQPDRLSEKPFVKHCSQLNWGRMPEMQKVKKIAEIPVSPTFCISGRIGKSFHVLAWVLQGFIGMVEQVHMRLSVFTCVCFTGVYMCL